MTNRMSETKKIPEEDDKHASCQNYNYSYQNTAFKTPKLAYDLKGFVITLLVKVAMRWQLLLHFVAEEFFLSLFSEH